MDGLDTVQVEGSIHEFHPVPNVQHQRDEKTDANRNDTYPGHLIVTTNCDC